MENQGGKIRRWTAKRKAALVLSILKGETSIREAARKHGLAIVDVEGYETIQRRTAPSITGVSEPCTI